MVTFGAYLFLLPKTVSKGQPQIYVNRGWIWGWIWNSDNSNSYKWYFKYKNVGNDKKSQPSTFDTPRIYVLDILTL